MIICSKCGVELEDDFKCCPLCGRNTTTDNNSENNAGSVPSDVIYSHRKESRKHSWELSGIIAFSGIIACTSVDLLIVKGLKWSFFANISIFTAWALLTLLIRLHRKPLILLPVLTLTLLAMLFILDLLTPLSTWFFSLGLPVTLNLMLITVILTILYRSEVFRGFNMLAVILLSASLYCIIDEVFIDKFMTGDISIKWSLIVTVSVLPIALVLFFVHYRMKKGGQLDSFFHV